MSDNRDIWQELIIKFLDGELSAEEKSQVDELMTNPSFTRELEEFRQIRNDIKKNEKRKALFAQMDSFHQEMTPEEPKKGKVISLRKVYWITSIAAMFAIVVTLGTIWLNGTFDEATSSESYENLAYKEESMEEEGEAAEATEAFTEEDDYNASYEKSVSYNTKATAFAIDKNGYFLTDYHVVEGAYELAITKPMEGTEYEARLISFDPLLDIALLQVTDTTFGSMKTIPYILSDDEARLGEIAYSLGYPKSDIVYGEGNISSINGKHSDTTSYQVSIPLNKGNSGSPVINSKGEIIAMVTDKKVAAEGTAYAIKSEYLIQFVDSLNTMNDLGIELPTKNKISKKDRLTQIERISPYVYQVLVAK